MKGGVGPHQGVAPFPVELSVYCVTRARQRPVAPQGVPNVVAFLAYVDHREAGEGAGIVRLTAPGGVESRAVELHPAADGVHFRDRGVEFP